jgi:deoxyhypusine synthase
MGKISEKAKRIIVEGDASVILPLMAGALFARLGKKGQAINRRQG